MRSAHWVDADRSALAWHPTQHDLLTSGGSDGSLLHWVLDSPTPRAAVKNAHESNIWSLAYHPLGVRRGAVSTPLTRQHTLASGGNDHALRWVRTSALLTSLTHAVVSLATRSALRFRQVPRRRESRARARQRSSEQV